MRRPMYRCRAVSTEGAWPWRAYLSENALHYKFGHSMQDREKLIFRLDADFQIESYLRHQGMSSVDHFDVNSDLYMTRAMDYFNLAANHEGRLAEALQGTKTRFCVVFFASFPRRATARSCTRSTLRAPPCPSLR